VFALALRDLKLSFLPLSHPGLICPGGRKGAAIQKDIAACAAVMHKMHFSNLAFPALRKFGGGDKKEVRRRKI
jgi:hypothetical protein